MSMGLAPVIVESLMPVVREVADETDAAVVLVEQHVHLALEVADTAIVLVHGDVALSGDARRRARRGPGARVRLPRGGAGYARDAPTGPGAPMELPGRRIAWRPSGDQAAKSGAVSKSSASTNWPSAVTVPMSM